MKNRIVDKSWLRAQYARTGTRPADFRKWANMNGIDLGRTEYSHVSDYHPVNVSKGYALAYMAFFQYVAPTKRVFYVEPRKGKRK